MTLFYTMDFKKKDKIILFFTKIGKLKDLMRFKNYKMADRVPIYIAINVFRSIYHDEPFDLIKYYKIFKIRNYDIR